MEVSSQLYAPAVLLQEERVPGTHWIHDWVRPRAGLDGVENIGISFPPGNRT
jgi:hypothetical protein